MAVYRFLFLGFILASPSWAAKKPPQVSLEGIRNLKTIENCLTDPEKKAVWLPKVVNRKESWNAYRMIPFGRSGVTPIFCVENTKTKSVFRIDLARWSGLSKYLNQSNWKESPEAVIAELLSFASLPYEIVENRPKYQVHFSKPEYRKIKYPRIGKRSGFIQIFDRVRGVVFELSWKTKDSGWAWNVRAVAKATAFY